MRRAIARYRSRGRRYDVTIMALTVDTAAIENFGGTIASLFVRGLMA